MKWQQWLIGITVIGLQHLPRALASTGEQYGGKDDVAENARNDDEETLREVSSIHITFD